MPFAVGALVAVVAWGLGGYLPWSMLVLELSAIALTGWAVASVVFRTTRSERERNVAVSRSRRSSLLGFLAKEPSYDVEITPPSGTPGTTGERESPGGESSLAGTGFDRVYVFGYAFRRTGVGVVALALTSWMALSLVPLPASWLSVLSPTAFSLRSEIATLVEGPQVELVPWSVTPFLSYQDVLLWLAYLMVFWVTYQLAGSARAVRRLTSSIVLVGIASGIYGLVQWLSLLGASMTEGAETTAGLMATGSFGNRNHYAFFQEMALLVGLGFVLLHFREATSGKRDRVSRQEANARTALLALGVACIGLSLLFSLSRSGITFAVVGAAALFVLARGLRRRRPSEPSATERPVRAGLAGLALCLVATALWIGIDPVLSRFELVPTELRADETGRTAVWRDSLGAVEDFWITGSGLSSFQYVFPIYRSFGGRRFYSWAHNDYLQIAIELGLPGLLLVGAILAWIGRRAYRIRVELSRRRGVRTGADGWSNLHAGYCAAAVAVALHSFTDFGLHLPANALLFAVVIGVVTGLSPERRSGRARKKSRKKKLRRSPPA